MRTILFVLLVTGAAAAQDALRARCEDLAAKWLAESAAPGVSVAVISKDGAVVAVAKGFADPETKAEITTDHKLFSGSIGKTYFAAVAHWLIAEGKLSLDDKAKAHLGGEPWFARLPNHADITVRQLMRHESGLPRWVMKPAFWQALAEEPERAWPPGSQLEFVHDDAPVHAAGDGWAYSDTNYIVLGLILEKVTGERATDLIDRLLLKPHGLRSTLAATRRELPGLVQGHARMFARMGVSGPVLRDGALWFDPSFEWAGGGYVSTPSDLARWARLYGSGGAIEADYVAGMLEGAVRAPMLGEDARYGLGVIVRESPLGPALGHDGVFIGFRATMAWFPEPRVAAAVQVNTDQPRAELRDLLLDLASAAAEQDR